MPVRLKLRAARRLLALASILTAGPALAADPFGMPGGEEARPQKKEGLSSVLGTLDWGASTTAVVKVLEEEVEARYEDRLAKADPIEVDRILREKSADLKKVTESIVRFDGQRTGFEASIIADDFRAGNGEALIRVEDGTAQRYFFFKDEQLWKILVIYSSSLARQVGFGGFVDQVQKKHGAALSRDEDDKGQLKAAVWEDALSRLVVQDRSLFGTFAMMFLDKGRGAEIEAGRPARRSALAQEANPAADSMIADIMAEGGGAENNVVDRITGSEHTVNLDVRGEQPLPLRREVDREPAGKPAKGATRPKKGKGAAADAVQDAAPPPAKGSDVIIY